MRITITAACFIALLIAPSRTRADEWQQVPSGGGENSHAPALSGGVDNRALGDFLAHTGTAPGKSGKACELVGTFANIAATLRDQGVTQERQLKDVGSTVEQTAGMKHLPHEWTGLISGVLRSEVAYVYEHREMTPDQVKAHWAEVCRSQGTGG